MKRALIFVSIPTQFREMIRVARLLKSSGRYEPLVFIADEYDGWKRDEALCLSEGISVRYFFEPSPAFSPANGSKGATRHVPALRRMWRAVYAGYWKFKLRHSALINGLLVGLPVLVLSMFEGIARRQAPAGFSARDGRATVLGRKMSAAFGRLWERDSRLLPGSLRQRRKLFKQWPDFFQSAKIDLLVLPEDNYFLKTHFLVRAARDAGAASVIVPFTVSNSLEWAQTFLRRKVHSARWLPNRIFAAAFPHWTYEYKGERMIMPPLEILMNEYLGLTPPNPWLINSGYTDALAAESPFMVRYYREAGIESEKIVLTGALSDDVLHGSLQQAEAARTHLYRKLGLPEDRPMLLFSVPPDQLIGDGRPQCEFGDYASLLRAILSALSRVKEWNVVASLHPRMDPKHRQVFADLSVPIASENIAELVPLCDVFVASASATIRLAAGAGKPTINYDVYRYEYTDFLGVPGVVPVSDLRAFEQAVDRITRDREYREGLAAKQREFAREQALVDGRSGERMLALFDKLTAT